MENFGKFVTIILVMIVSIIVTSFVFLKLWDWFIVPTFDMQPLRLVEAIGLMFLINYLTIKQNKEIKKDTFWEELGINFMIVIVYSGLVLFFGWIVNLFM